jgi:hypothetical protein
MSSSREPFEIGHIVCTDRRQRDRDPRGHLGTLGRLPRFRQVRPGLSQNFLLCSAPTQRRRPESNRCFVPIVGGASARTPPGSRRLSRRPFVGVELGTVMSAGICPCGGWNTDRTCQVRAEPPNNEANAPSPRTTHPQNATVVVVGRNDLAASCERLGDRFDARLFRKPGSVRRV